jgi:hypothetical protein
MSSLINSETWTVGVGDLPRFVQMPRYVESSNLENLRLVDLNPWGQLGVVWESINLGTDPNRTSGGFFTTRPQTPSDPWYMTSGVPYVLIDTNNTYRFSIWINRRVLGNGWFMMQVGSRGPALLYSSYTLANIATGVSSSVLFQVDPPGLANTWMLAVSHIHSYAYGETTPHPDSGLWYLNGTKYADAAMDGKWTDTRAIYTTMLCDLYNSTDPTTRQRYFEPRIDLVDGTEPTLQQLLNNVNRQIIFKSQYGYLSIQAKS